MAAPEPTPVPPPEPSAPPKRGFLYRWIRRGVIFCIGIALICCIVRPFLPRVVRYYVNRVLDQSTLYKGKIGDINLHLWRGAYTIRDIRILKTTGNIPVPFFSGKELDLAVEWRALFKRKVVCHVEVNEPEINFVDDPNPGAGETGAGGPWLKILSDLFPFDINSVKINNGSIHFRTYQAAKPVDVYLSQLEATVDDLTNVNRSITPLLTTVKANGLAMDQAKFQFLMKLNPFSYNPTFKVGLRLIGLDITTTNDLVEAYGQFDVKRGLFDLVVDLTADEGELSGYVKPLFRNMVIFDLVQDIKDDDPLRLFWQGIVGGAAEIVTNHGRDQLATVIPITGQLQGPNIDILGTIGNVLKNAFIRAYLPRLESNSQSVGGMQFGPAELTDPDMSSTDP